MKKLFIVFIFMASTLYAGVSISTNFGFIFSDHRAHVVEISHGFYYDNCHYGEYDRDGFFIDDRFYHYDEYYSFQDRLHHRAHPHLHHHKKRKRVRHTNRRDPHMVHKEHHRPHRDREHRHRSRDHRDH